VTFEELLYAFFDRGFSDVEAYLPRAKRWINQSYLGLCEAYPWPFLEKDATGPAPLALPDMRAVLSVNAGQGAPIGYIDRRTLTEIAGDLAAVGDPALYYLEDQALKTYPVSQAALRVRYLHVPPELVNPQDRPTFPERFQELIVDRAVLKGYRDLDNWEAYNAMRTEHERELLEMAASLMVRNHSDPTVMVYSHAE
jgi:hypothetical protein